MLQLFSQAHWNFLKIFYELNWGVLWENPPETYNNFLQGVIRVSLRTFYQMFSNNYCGNNNYFLCTSPKMSKKQVLHSSMVFTIHFFLLTQKNSPKYSFKQKYYQYIFTFSTSKFVRPLRKWLHQEFLGGCTWTTSLNSLIILEKSCCYCLFMCS